MLGEYDVQAIPLRTFLGDQLGDLQLSDALVGPNYTADMAGLELDTREVFEEFRRRMTVGYSLLYAYRLALAIGHDDRGFQRLVWRTTRRLLAIWSCVVVVVATELHRRDTLDGLAVRRLVQRELGLRGRWRTHGDPVSPRRF